MSFSGDLKKDLSRILPDEYHCLLAETAAIQRFAGITEGGAEHGTIRLETDSVVLAKKYLRLIKKAFDISVELDIHRGSSGRANVYRILLSSGGNDGSDAEKCGDTAAEDGSSDAAENFRRVWRETADWEDPEFSESLLEYSCCRRAFIRGAFLSAGSMSDPGKSYHFEIVCRSREEAELLARVIATFDIEPKTASRKNRFIVYLKDSEAIIDILNVMGASGALMYVENVRIIKDMKNSANRQSNCDSANISKTVRAASRQLDDIRLIGETMGLESLNPQLREMAEVRLEHPEDSLRELGEYLHPAVGKSGVNHRLAKLAEIAEGIRRGNKKFSD